MGLLRRRKQPWIQVNSPKCCLCTTAPFHETRWFCFTWRETHSKSMGKMKTTFVFGLNCLTGPQPCFQVRDPINTSEPNLFHWKHFQIHPVRNATAVRWAGEPWHPVTASLGLSLPPQWLSMRKFSASEGSSGGGGGGGGRENIEILIKRREKKNTLLSLWPTFARVISPAAARFSIKTVSRDAQWPGIRVEGGAGW